MSVIVKTENLCKGYFSKKALENFNLEMEKGKVYGLLGPNGSGKTTFLKMAAGLMKPTSGRITINGFEPGAKTKAQVAFMSSEEYLFSWMKIQEMLNFFQDMYGDFDRKKCLEYLDTLKLTPDLKIRSLSNGMRAGLKLALVFSRKASLFLLDEPLNGIDIIIRDQILAMILEEVRGDSALMVTSHLVNELEPILDEVIFLDKGSTILAGKAEEFRQTRNCSIEQLYREVYHA